MRLNEIESTSTKGILEELDVKLEYIQENSQAISASEKAINHIRDHLESGNEHRIERGIMMINILCDGMIKVDPSSKERMEKIRQELSELACKGT